MLTVIHIVGLVVTGMLLAIGLMFVFLLLQVRAILAGSRKPALVGLTRYLLNLFEGPLQRVLPRADVDECQVKILNRYFEEAYRSTRVDERIVFLPGCLRHHECRARLDPNVGLVCIGCRRCPIGEFLADTKETHAKVFVIPGGRFVERIARTHKAKAVLGVGCLSEIREGMQMAGAIHLCPQSVRLESDGCVNTSVNWDSVREALLVGDKRPPSKR